MTRTSFGSSWLVIVLYVPSVIADAPSAEPVTVAFGLLQTKHIFVNIQVNGKGPYRVIFDTGAPVILLNRKVGRASGIINQDARPAFFTAFGSMGQFQARTLQIGKLESKNVPITIMDHPTIEMISKILGPIEGIVGFPFFARYKTTIDYQRQQLTFTPNGYRPRDSMQVLMKSIMALAEDEGPKAQMLMPSAQWGITLHKDSDDDDPGVTIEQVMEGSAAAASGLRPGDRLLTLDGRWTDTVADAYRAANLARAGGSVEVAVQRARSRLVLKVNPRPGI